MTGKILNFPTPPAPKEYFQMCFDGLPDEDKVAIIAFMCGTNLDIFEAIRDIEQDIRNMLDAGIRHIDQVKSFAEDILNSTSFDKAYFNEWINMDPFNLDFDVNMFWHILFEMNEDMRTVVRFCYPFDDESNLVQNGEIPFFEAFCR